METDNYVSKLNEYVQKEYYELRYENGGSVGPDHDKRFIQRAVINGKVYPDGSGKTKKDAKQDAAKNALKCLRENEQHDFAVSTEEAAGASAAPVHQTSNTNINYVSWLNEYGQKNSLTIRAVESTKAEPNNTTHFMVGDKEYPAGFGKTKREAKEEAAKLVYDVIYGDKTTETASSQQKEKLIPSEICNTISSLGASSSSSIKEIDYQGLVNHYCQKTNRSRSYTEVRRCGPPNDPRFFFKLVIDGKDYPVAEGKSIKEAKQNAAQVAVSALQKHSDWDSQVSLRSTGLEVGAPPTLSEQSTTWESSKSRSQRTSLSTGGSIISTDSSNPLKAQATIKADREKLLEMLEDLKQEEFKKFKWFLQTGDVLAGHPRIPGGKLEKADVLDVVDLMFQTHSQHFVEVAKEIFKKVNRNDLANAL